MPHSQLCRIKVRAEMCLQPGWLRVSPLPLAPPPDGMVRLGPDGVPSDMPLSLLPPDLREVGAVFWMVFDPASREAVGFERLEGAA